MSFLQVDPFRDCYLHFSASFPPAAVRILSHIFLASSLLLGFPRSHPGGISRNWMWCQGCCKLPNEKTDCILQGNGCARMGRTDGWTCRTSFSHKCSEHRKCSVAFLFSFLKAEIYLGSTCSNYRLSQILTSGNWAGGKKILWRAQACVGSCCICLTIITGATLAAGWNVAVNRKYTLRVLKYESGAGTKSRHQTDFPC